MTELPDNILHLPQYQVLGCKSTDDEMHFQVDVPDPIACEECGVQGEFVRFGKRDVPYRDLPIHGKRVTLWVVRRRYTCRACKTTFRPQLPEMVDGFRMTLRLHEYVEKESFNHPYTFVAAQTGLDEKTVRDIFNARAEFLGRWHRFETPRILGIDELYLNKRYRCILTNIEERPLLDLLATRRQDVVTNYLMKLKDRQKVEIVSMDMWNPYRAAVKAVLPQARIVVDKFHVVRMANDALERVRKGLRKELKPSQSRTLKGDRKILLKRAHEVSDRERLIMETWTGAFPKLLAAYEHFPGFYQQLTVGLPESGHGLPDVLNEALWNLDWMLTMQDPNDGGVYHKLTNKVFDGMVMPEKATAPRYVVQKTTTATLDFAAVMAVASRVLEPFDSQQPGRSARYLAAAESAWRWPR